MQLERPDFTELLQLLAHTFKVRVTNMQFAVNPIFGKGFCWAERLPSGITVIVSDTSLKEDLIVERPEMMQHYFTLQFNEEAADETEAVLKSKRNTEEYQSFVKLSHTLVPETFVFPGSKRLRSVKFFFNNTQLMSLLGKQAYEKVINGYFPYEIKNEKLEPIATEYRVMFDELLSDTIDQPLKLNYIQNRVLLLLEKYIVRLYGRRNQQGKKANRREDETLRLMKVEALLVKNFSLAPPTIHELSRVSAMCPTKLKTDFKSLYGLPIYVYYQKNRMLKAKSLLVQSKYAIREIGQMVGYSNLSHFANTFKKEFGFLPSEIAVKDGMLVYSKDEI